MGIPSESQSPPQVSREVVRPGSLPLLAICGKLFLIITSARSTVDEPYVPNTVNRSFDLDHRVPCRLDRARSERLGYINPSTTALHRVFDPHRLIPTRVKPLRIETLLVLPNQLSDPAFICKILEDYNLSPSYMQTRLDYTKRCITLETFTLSLEPGASNGPWTASNILTRSPKGQKAWATFFRDFTQLLSTLPARSVYDSLKDSGSQDMELVVSVDAVFRDDVLDLVDATSNRYDISLPPCGHPSKCFSLTIQHFTNNASQSLLKSLHSLLRQIPRTINLRKPPYISIAFRWFPDVLHSTQISPPISKGFRLAALRLPTLFESRPPSPSPNSLSTDSMLYHPRTLSSSFETRPASRKRNDSIPTLHIDHLMNGGHKVSASITTILSQTSINEFDDISSIVRSSLVFDIRRTSGDSTTRISLERRAWITTSLSSETRLSAVSSSASNFDNEASHETIMRCLVKNGYRLDFLGATDTTDDGVSPSDEQILVSSSPPYPPSYASSAAFRASLSSLSSRLSYTTADFVVDLPTRVSSSSETTSITYLTAPSCEPNSRASYSTISSTSASFYSTLSFIDPYPSHNDAPNDTPSADEPLLNSEVRGFSIPHHTHHHSNTYHIHLHIHGDSYHGPIHGGIVGGRNNSNVNSAGALLSEIDEILREIRSYGQTTP